jgi:hypothetical protein
VSQFIDRLDHHFDPAWAMKAVEHRLPCDRCRGGEKVLHSINKVRLGRIEKNLFLKAAPPEIKSDEKPALVAEGCASRSERESALRARRKLVTAGLIKDWEWYDERSVKPSSYVTEYGFTVSIRATSGCYSFASLVLTPVGAAILKHYRQQIENGSSLRAAATDSAVLDDFRLRGYELLRIFEHSLYQWPVCAKDWWLPDAPDQKPGDYVEALWLPIHEVTGPYKEEQRNEAS